MSNRRGFTLIEIMIALVILALVVLGMATSTGRFIRVVAESDWQVAAIPLYALWPANATAYDNTGFGVGIRLK